MSGPFVVRELTCDEVRDMAGAFVLGALEAADAASVRAHLATCREAHEEIAELGSVVPAFVEIVPLVEPPADLKARIMAAAAADAAAATQRGRAARPAHSAVPAGVRLDGAGATDAPATVSPAAAPVSFPTSRLGPRRVPTTTGTWALRIAAVLAISTLGGWNLVLQNQLNEAQQGDRNLAAILDAAARPGSLTAVLAGDGGAGSGLAAVDAAGHLTIAMRDLPPTTGSAVYEAWVIGGDGIPVPLGSFQVGPTGVAYFESSGLPSAEGIVLALTLEPGPGATSPTLPIIAKGVATAPG